MSEEDRSIQLTRAEVDWCLRLAPGNVTAASKLAGMSRPTFYRAMRRVGVRVERG